MPEATCRPHARRLGGVGAISLGEADYAPGAAIPDHHHATATICLVLGGDYDERLSATSFLCEAGTLVFLAPGEVHSDRFGEEGGRCFTISLPEAMLVEWAREGEAPQWLVSRQSRPSRFAYELHRRARAGAPGQEDVEELTLALLEDVHAAAGVSSAARPPPWLSRIRDRAHEEFRRLPTLEELAREAGVHRVHVAREFRRQFGCTIGEYARRRRIEYACTRLRDPEADLSAAAYAAGFADQAHMTRSFRRELHVTPGEFRARYAAESPARRRRLLPFNTPFSPSG